MSLVLSELPYAIDAHAGHGMSRETMEYHHDIHHKAYVDNGNNLLKGTEWENKSLEEIIVGTYDAKSVAQNGIFNNVSQHWNHEQFWQMMGPSKVNMPSELENAITSSFGSVDKFKEDFFESREMYDLLKSFYQYGFAIIKNVPTYNNYIVQFANSIGSIRPTNFGEYFNVESVPNPNDLAYTSLALSPHPKAHPLVHVVSFRLGNLQCNPESQKNVPYSL